MTLDPAIDVERILASPTSNVDERVESLIDAIEPICSIDESLSSLVWRFRDQRDPALARALSFCVAQSAFRAAAESRNLMYALVDAVVASGDVSAHTNLLTCVKRLARGGVPWYPADDPAPSELASLLVSALQNGSRNVDDARDALDDLGSSVLRLPPGDRETLATSVETIAPNLAAQLRGG